jgi:hypothetical protein
MPNQPPTADAGEDTLWSVDKVFVLDGSNSFDLDGDTLHFQWSFVDVPSASALTNADIENADSAIANFLPHHFGEFRLLLEVSDGQATRTDLLSVYAKENVPPIPDAGADSQAGVGEIVFLDARASGDPDGDTLDFSWRFLAVPHESDLTDLDISGHLEAEAFFVPDTSGEFVVELQADDGFFVSQDSLLVQVEDSGFGCSSAGDFLGVGTVSGWVLGILFLRGRRVV